MQNSFTKKFLLFSCLIFTCFLTLKRAHAQLPVQVIWTDDLNQPIPNWTINQSGITLISGGSNPTQQGASSNRWILGAVPTSPVFYESPDGTQALYISCNANECGDDRPFFLTNGAAYQTNKIAHLKNNFRIIPSLFADAAKYFFEFECLFPNGSLPNPNIGLRVVYSIPNPDGSIAPGGSWFEFPGLTIFKTDGLDTIPVQINTLPQFSLIKQRGLYVGFRWFNGLSGTDEKAAIIDNLKLKKQAILNLNSVSPLTICSGSQIAINATAGGFEPGTTLSAQLVDGGGGITNLGNIGNGTFTFTIPTDQATGQYTVQLEAQTPDGASFLSNTLPITIYKSPAKPSAGQDASICSGPPDGVTVSIGSQNPEQGVDYVWSPVLGTPPNDYFVPNLSGTPAAALLENLGLAPITHNFVVTATTTGSGCSSKDTVRVTVYPNPRIFIPLTNENACDNSTSPVPISISIVPSATSQPPLPSTAVASGIWTGQGVTLIGTNYFFNPAGLTGNITLTYEHEIKWTVNGPTCKFKPPVANTKIFSISKAPVVTPVTEIPLFCGNGTPVQLQNPTSDQTGSVFTWAGPGIVLEDGLFDPSSPSVQPNPNQVLPREIELNVTTSKTYPGPPPLAPVTCSTTINQKVRVKNPPKVEAGLAKDTICEGQKLRFTGFFPVGTGNGQQPPRGQWSGPGLDAASLEFNPDSVIFRTNVASNPISQTNTLTYRYTDADKCSNSDQRIIYVLPKPAAFAGLDRTVCSGQKTLVGSSAQQNARNKYRWTSPPASFFDDADTSITGLTLRNDFGTKPQKVSARLLVTDTVTKCFNADTIELTVNPVPKSTLIIPADTNSCEGNSILLKPNLALYPDTTKFRFQWFRDGFPLTAVSETDRNFPVNNSGKYRVAISFKNLNCFDTSTAISLRFNPTIKPRVVGEANFCGNNPVQLWAVPANPAFGYEWKFVPLPTSLDPDPDTSILPGIPLASIRLAKQGSLMVSLLTNNGCKSLSDPISITRLVQPIVQLQQSSPLFCENSNQYFFTLDSTYKVLNNSGTGPDSLTRSHFQFRWRDSTNRNIILSDSSKLFPKAAGTYYLDVYNNCGTVSDTFRLFKILPAPQFGILANGRRDTTVCLDQPFSLTAPSAFSEYMWTWGNPTNPSSYDTLRSVEINNLPVDTTGTFNLNLEIQDQFGCKNDDSVTIKVIRCRPELFIPTAFMPVEKPGSDQERKNSMWFFNGYGIVSTKWYIYSRWGEMVASGNNYGEPQTDTDGKGWDGTFQSSGQPCPTGSYKYVIEYTGQNDNATKKLTGDIMLIR